MSRTLFQFKVAERNISQEYLVNLAVCPMYSPCPSPLPLPLPAAEFPQETKLLAPLMTVCLTEGMVWCWRLATMVRM